MAMKWNRDFVSTRARVSKTATDLQNIKDTDENVVRETAQDEDNCVGVT